jgi:hypothetical protein
VTRRLNPWRMFGAFLMAVSAAVVVGGLLVLCWALIPFAVHP